MLKFPPRQRHSQKLSIAILDSHKGHAHRMTIWDMWTTTLSVSGVQATTFIFAFCVCRWLFFMTSESRVRLLQLPVTCSFPSIVLLKLSVLRLTCNRRILSFIPTPVSSSTFCIYLHNSGGAAQASTSRTICAKRLTLLQTDCCH